MRDCRSALKLENGQTICDVGINNCLTRAIVDTDSYETIISRGMCEALGMQFERVRGSIFGTSEVPGSGVTSSF